MNMSALLNRPWAILAAWLLLMSLILFAAMGDDKRRAIRKLRRIPEARLFLLAALGGALGGCCGMFLFRHKTRHWTFVLGFPLLTIAQLAFFGYLLLQTI